MHQGEVRVRFPPSPTGYLHIGSARTAIYNWLFARKTGGKLILRIEDTDVERSTEEAIQGILDGLRWLGITWDEGPYFQSAFAEEHRQAAQNLLESGHAYKCFCTPEELQRKREEAKKKRLDYNYDGTCRNLPSSKVARLEAEGRKYVIRFKVPRGPGAVLFKDAVYGTIEKKYRDIEDFVIVRSNGQPLYVLSNAVDDIRDRISHIIRGQDHLANTPKQILIYQGLGAPLPQFAHMSLTLDPQKRKISKRSHGEAVTVQFYRERGFLPWALVNFLVLLGWSTSDNREIFSPEELIEAFSLEGLNRANAIFDIRKNDPKFFTDPKAISMNAHYLRTMPVEELLPYVQAELEEAGLWQTEYAREKRPWFVNTIELIRSRYHTTKDFVHLGRPYFTDDFVMDEAAVRKRILKHADLKEWLPLLARRLEQLDDFNQETVEEVIRGFAGELQVKPGVLINAVRVAVTGQSAGPGLFDVLVAVGQDRVVKRLLAVPQLFAERLESTELSGQ
ncbi:MAG: glutamate--tRNA ligase [Deltaproteobacteria bacterium]|nr:glutamate--tRNA ligase [Deltaproteobacteria bacterium]MBW2071111.1 glutamate--tRNA ligase [Deltaproteobacteria bacterium]